jgi:hypothetical protein
MITPRHAACKIVFKGNGLQVTAASFAQLNQHFDFDRGAQWKCDRSHRRASMSATLTENVLQQLAGAVGDLGLVGEFRVAAHKHAQSNNSRDALQMAVQPLVHDCQGVERALFGGTLGLIDRDAGGDRPGAKQFAVEHWYLPTDEQKAAGLDGWHVRGDGFCHRRQRQPQFCQSILRACHDVVPFVRNSVGSGEKFIFFRTPKQLDVETYRIILLSGSRVLP